MNCEKSRNPETVEQYLTGSLSSDESADFESHFFECDECLAAVQTGQAIQQMGAPDSIPLNQPKSSGSRVVEMPVRGKWRAVYPLAAAAAAIIAAVIGWRAFKSPGTNKVEIASTSQVSPIAKPVPPARAPAIDSKSVTPDSQPVEHQLMAFNRLEAVDPLAYRASVLRGGGDDAAEQFRSAMQAYVARDYRKATERLSMIPVGVPGSGKADAHITDAGIQLYLGVSKLMLTENDDAVRALRRSVAYGDTPYLETAGFYLAKGLIREKQYSQAAAQLRETVALNGDRRGEAQQLLTQLEAIPSNQLPSR